MFLETWIPYVINILKVLVIFYAKYYERPIAYCQKSITYVGTALQFVYTCLFAKICLKGIQCRIYNLVSWTWALHSEAFPFPQYDT